MHHCYQWILLTQTSNLFSKFPPQLMAISCSSHLGQNILGSYISHTSYLLSGMVGTISPTSVLGRGHQDVQELKHCKYASKVLSSEMADHPLTGKKVQGEHGSPQRVQRDWLFMKVVCFVLVRFSI